MLYICGNGEHMYIFVRSSFYTELINNMFLVLFGLCPYRDAAGLRGVAVVLVGSVCGAVFPQRHAPPHTLHLAKAVQQRHPLP